MPTDLDKLQGTWNVATLELDGQQTPSATFDGARIVIRKNRFESLGMGATYEGMLEVDETKKPKAFDLVFTAGHAAGTRNLGIYKLDGDRWTICLATAGATRPSKFATRPGTGLALETLQRRRAEGAATKRKPRSGTARAGSVASTATANTKERSADAPSELDGEWAMVEGVFNGATMDEKMVKWCKRVSRDNVTTVLAGPQVMLKASFTVDNSKNPREVDYMNLEGSNRGKAQVGIVELRGETLRVCMSPPGTPRPSDFSSKSGDGRSYTTWRLLKR